MAEYRGDAVFDGDVKRALDVAARMLAQMGYRIKALGPSKLQAEHPGLLQRSTGQAMLLASPIRVTASLGRLQIEADFDGIAKLRRFLIRFLLGLGALLALVLGVSFAIIFDERWPVFLGVGLGAGIPLLQLPIHLLLTLRLIRERAIRDLETFLGNLILLSKTG